MERIKNKTHDILRWSEKYTKTDMVYLASGGFWLFLKQGITLVIGFVVSIAFANMLDPEVYGNYKYIITFAGIVGAFSLTGLGNSLTRSVAKGYDGTLFIAFKKAMKWSVVPSIILLSGSIYYFIKDNILLSTSLLVISFLQPIITSTSLYGHFFNGKKRFDLNSSYGIIFGIFTSLSILITLLLTKNILTIVIVNFISTALISIILYKYSLKFVENNLVDTDSVHYAKHLSVINLVVTLAEKIDSILLFTFLGGTQLAIYSFATLIPEQILNSFRNISTLAFPKLSTQKKDEVQKGIYLKSLRLSFYALTVIVAYVIISPIIFKLFFPAYIESILLSQIYAIGVLVVVSMLPATALTSLGSKKELHQINISSSIVQIISLFILVYFYGIWGAVFSKLIYRLVKVILTFIFFKKYFNKEVLA